MKTLSPFLLTLLFLSGDLSAAKQIINCPLELPPEAMTIAERGDGWQPFVSSPLYLHDAAPIAGPPDRLGTIMGKTQKRGKAEWTETYKLDVGYPEGVWFQCSYGVSNSHTLSIKLDNSVKSCVVKGTVGTKFGQNIFEIRCS